MNNFNLDDDKEKLWRDPWFLITLEEYGTRATKNQSEMLCCLGEGVKNKNTQIQELQMEYKVKYKARKNHMGRREETSRR